VPAIQESVQFALELAGAVSHFQEMLERRRHRKNYNEPGHAHELTFSCFRRHKFLQSDRTCSWLAESLQNACRHWQVDLWAYVFMPEHVHLLVHPREVIYDIADVRKAIKAPVAEKALAYLESHRPEWIPRVTRRRGKSVERLFWQSGGGYDRNVDEPRTLWKMIEYIHLNPVRRGLVERAEDWKWSSAGYYLKGAVPPIPIDPIPPEWGM
jgi:putative transposase